MRFQLASYVSLAVLASSFLLSTANAQIELTEVDLTTNQIELTNIGGSIETGGILEWCIPFSYGVLETAGYSFLPGETRTYDLGFNVGSANDLWIYRNRSGGFGQTDRVISGVVWGSDQSGQGRVNAVVTSTGGEAWAMNTDFVDTAGILAGQTMQVAAPALNPNSSSGWDDRRQHDGFFRCHNRCRSQRHCRLRRFDSSDGSPTRVRRMTSLPTSPVTELWTRAIAIRGYAKPAASLWAMQISTTR